jgi:hypothetical protein
VNGSDYRISNCDTVDGSKCKSEWNKFAIPNTA